MAKIRNVPFPRPCGATGNDAQKLHAPAFAHFRGAVLRHEVFCPFSAEHNANQAAGFTTKSAALRLSKKPVIASQCAPRSKCPWGTHWRGNPFLKRTNSALFAGFCLKRYGFPRRFAPRNDRGEVYRHAASRWFHYESAAFFVPKKFFEIFSFRGSINEPSRCLPI